MMIKRAIISGGGTGGHIFPALAIANEIRKRYPGAELLFVGARGRMEMEKVPAAGYQIVGLPVMGFPRKPGVKTLQFFVRLLKSARQARQIVKDFNPQVAIGVGGYASGPLLRAAAGKGIPTLIQEQNSYAGITNKLLSRKANKICVAYEKMERFFPGDKIILSGNPVREDLLNESDNRKEGLAYYKLKDAGKVIVIVGGSLGAGSINRSVLQNLNTISESDVQVIWQTGSYYYDGIMEEVGVNIPENLRIVKFIDRMDLAYSVADLVISRAGAGTISELCLVGKPCILIPSPNVAEDHQTKNAMALVEKNAAIMITDKDLGNQLFNVTLSVVNDEQKCKELSANIAALARPEATKTIVDEVEKLI